MWEKVAQLNTWLVYLLLFIIALAGSAILHQLANSGKRSSQNNSAPQKKGLGCLTILFLLLVGLSLLFFTAYLRAYHAFTQQELVARILCERAPQDISSFYLTYIPVLRGKEQIPVKYAINGDQWVVGGDIVKWKDLFTFLGLKSMYRVTMIEGQFLQENAEKGGTPSIYYINKDQKNGIWKYFYQIGDKLFFVSGVYGAKVFNYPGYTSYYEIFVTEDGFIMKKYDREGRSIGKQILDSVLETKERQNFSPRR